jgi:sugar (pentulose or hexulose) kinase
LPRNKIVVAKAYVLGVDIGTSGVKVLALSKDGHVVATGGADLPAPVVVGHLREQDPELWWTATLNALQDTLQKLRAEGIDSGDISAVAVDATSGTIVAVDRRLKTLRAAIMYNDQRAGIQAIKLNTHAGQILERLGYQFNATFSLAKLLWLYENEPHVIEQAAWILHQADFITARLTGITDKGLTPISDESNSLKTGYDILSRCWPDYIAQAGIETSKLPSVVPIGATIGTIEPKIAETFGFSPSCRMVAGMTDGTAGCAASGARNIGDMNTTLGTTIVWKTIASSLICDPQGRLYSHRHPGGGFLPGGAGNAGGAGIRAFIGSLTQSIDQRLNQLAQTLKIRPLTGTITYPLPSPGERFPFLDAKFEGFTTAAGDEMLLYRSCLEGIACIERWGYEIAAELGAECNGAVWTTGRGAHLDGWMQIRADIVGRPVCRSAYPEAAFGAALVAAMNVWFNGVWQDTVDQLSGETYRWEPSDSHRAVCDEQYGRFREACQQRRSH